MSAGHKKKILIVEDEAALLSALQAQLRLDGYTVESAGDGVAALTKLKNFKPDLIVLDIILPRTDGWEVLSRIRTDVRLVGMPIVIITNLNDKKTRQRCEEYGVEDFIPKANYNLMELVEKIKKVL